MPAVSLNLVAKDFCLKMSSVILLTVAFQRFPLLNLPEYQYSLLWRVHSQRRALRFPSKHCYLWKLSLTVI